MALESMQVKPHVAAANVTAAAQRVSNGNAQLALELVGFDQDLSAAMQYVFGNAFVCKVSPLHSLSGFRACLGDCSAIKTLHHADLMAIPSWWL